MPTDADIEAGMTGGDAPPSAGAPIQGEDTETGMTGGSGYEQAIQTGLVDAIPYGRKAAAAADTYLPTWLSGTKDASSDYGENLARINKMEAQSERDHPIVKYGTSILGGTAAMPVGGAAEALGTGVARALPSAARIAPWIGDIGAGAGLGAAYGAGGGDSAFDTSGALTGALTGGIGGAAARPIAAGLGNIGRGIAHATGFYDPETEAAGRIAGAFGSDERAGNQAMTPADFAAGKAAGQPVIAGDLGGPAVRGLARTAANVSPEARGVLQNAVGDRYYDQSGRFSDYIDGLFPGKNLNTQMERDEIATQAKNANTPAYKAAYSDPNAGSVWSPKLASLMNSDEVQKGIGLAQSKARADAALNGTAPINNPFVQGSDGKWRLAQTGPNAQTATPSLQWWDYVKRGLDTQRNTAIRSGDNDGARVVGQLSDALKGELDQQVPAYAQARASAARFFGQDNAVDGAIAFDKMRGEPQINQAVMQLRGMDPQDKEIFARAYGAQLKQRAMNPNNSTDLARQFDNKALQTKMNFALNTQSNPGRATDMEAFVRRESMMNQMRNAIGGNSTTAQQLSDAASQGHGGGGLGAMIGKQFGSIGGGAIGGAGAVYHETQGDPFEERAKKVMGGALAGAAAGFVGARGNAASAAVMRSIGEQLASSDPNVYQNALQKASHTPAIMDALRKAEMTMAAQSGGAFSGGQ